MDGFAGGFQQAGHNGCGGGFAVGTGNPVNWCRTERKEKLHFRSNRDALSSGCVKFRQIGFHARRTQDQLGILNAVEIPFAQAQGNPILFQLIGRLAELFAGAFVAGRYPSPMTEKLTDHRQVVMTDAADGNWLISQLLQKGFGRILAAFHDGSPYFPVILNFLFLLY